METTLGFAGRHKRCHGYARGMRIATRYDRLGRNYRAVLALVAVAAAWAR